MAAVSFVAGSTTATGSSTSITATTPAGIQDGDGLVAWMIGRATITPPAGWTLITSVDVTASSITQTLWAFSKDTVTAANSSTSYTFSQASSLTFAICYQVVRAESGVIRFRNAATASSTGTSLVTPPAVTADRGQEMILIGAGCILQSSSTYTPTPPTTFTLSSGGVANNRCAAAYRQSNAGYTNSGTFQMSGTATNQGNHAITLLATDRQELVFLEEGLDLLLEEDLSASFYGVVADETLGLHGLLGILYQDGLEDGVTLSDAPAYIHVLLGALDEALRFIAHEPVGAWGKSASETIALNPEALATRGAILLEGLGVDETVVCNQKVALLLAEALEAAAEITAARPLVLTEALDLALTVQAAASVVVIQELGLTEIIAPIATYHLTVAQNLGVADTLSRFLGGGISEAIAFEQTDARQMVFRQALEEGLGVDETVTPYFILKATASDEIGLSDTEALQQIFNGQIAEGLELSGAYIGPDGSFTTWAMNTRTGAVSEYENYAFNSFARVGNKYLGASSSGLYELLGATDDGASVVATLRGGYLQFAGTRLSRLKAAYIAMTGADTAVLKIETKDGVSYTYSIDTRAGRSSKVHMGKGQRSRYFAWELTTVGQDFDLDTLEFVPVRVDRRV